MSENNQHNSGKVIAVVAVDMATSPIGTRSRLADQFAGKPVLTHTVEKLLAVQDVSTIVLMVASGQEQQVRALPGVCASERVVLMTLMPRPEKLTTRTIAARAWDLVAWRGGAGQTTVFDEDFCTQSILAAAETQQADHVLCVPAHAALLDVDLMSRLVQHHLYKNHEMRATYTPAAPGLGGIVIQTPMLREIAPLHILPGHVLQYDPRSPTFDTLIRDACMQVDPALSKIQNRFLLDNDRSLAIAEALLPRMPFKCAADMAIAAAEIRATAFAWPREIEIELTARRFSAPPGSVPEHLRAKRAELDADTWAAWLKNQKWPDDMLLTLCGDGDPLAYAGIADVCAAAREAGIRHIHLQTDLIENTARATELIDRKMVDVISVTHYGHTPGTYARVGQVAAETQPQVMKNMQMLLDHINAVGSGLPLVLCRLLKVRDTIPEMEEFFDTWCLRCGWAVIDAPTDRAGDVPFTAVVDMAPPKRRACRRIADRLLIRADGALVACDQDVHDKLMLGHVSRDTLLAAWQGNAMCSLKNAHASGNWLSVDPCRNCREWHRP